MQSSSSLLLNYPDATRREKALIRLLAERAEKVCPGVKVRFVQRDTDGAEILLIVGLQTPVASDFDNYDLHAISQELSERYKDLVLTLKQKNAPVDGKQFLKLRKVLRKDQVAADFIEPPPVSLRKRLFDLNRDSVAMMILLLLYVLGYATGFLHTSSQTPKSTHVQSTAPPVKTVEETVQEAMRRIDAEMGNSGKLKLSPEKLEKLENSKRDLGRAYKTLLQTKYPDLEDGSVKSSRSGEHK